MEFYRKVRTRPPARALAYAAAFFVVMSLVFGLLVVLPGLYSLFGVVRDGVNEQLPDGTSFEIQNGQFSTTLPPATEFRYEDIVIVLDPTLEGQEFPKAFEDRQGNYFGRDALFAQYFEDQQGSHGDIRPTPIGEPTLGRFFGNRHVRQVVERYDLSPCRRSWILFFPISVWTCLWFMWWCFS